MLREQLRARTSGKRQAYASNNASQYTNGDLTRLNSTDSAFSLSTEDRMGTRVIEMESEIKSLKVSYFSYVLVMKFKILPSIYKYYRRRSCYYDFVRKFVGI